MPACSYSVSRSVPAWTQISEGGQEPVILAVDFEGRAGREATFRELVRAFPRRVPVWQAVQPSEGYPADGRAHRYLSWWRQRPQAGAVPVSAVLGYCAGSVFAAAIADELEDQQGRRPVVVLFNPGQPTLATLTRDLEGAIAGMDPLTPEERCRFYAEGRDVLAAGEPFGRASARVLDVYRRAAKVATHRLALDVSIEGELVELFQSYLSYLRAARELQVRPNWATAHGLTSADFVPGREFGPPGARLSTGRADLLRSREAARATFQLLSDG